MGNQSLEKCVSLLYDMELNNYLMVRGIQQLDKKIAALGRSRRFANPTKKKNDVAISDGLWSGVSVGGILGGVVGIIYGLMVGEGFFGKLFEIIGGVILFALILGAIGALIGLIWGIGRKYAQQKKIDAQYNSECEERQMSVVLDSMRVDAEQRERAVLTQEKNKLMQRKNEAGAKLREFYRQSGIDKQYQNLIPIGYMNEFIRLGISTELEGVNGLYYLIRQELRWDQMQYTLEEISDKLDFLIDGQHQLHNELVSINRKCDQLVNAAIRMAENAAKNQQLLERTAAATEITAYNSERISQELLYQNFMLTFTRSR